MDAPDLLNDDGTASIATAVMMSHHGFRRDLRGFAGALARAPSMDRLREEWARFHLTLHGHHQGEDGGVFPSVASRCKAETIARLEAEHRLVDPLLERADRAFEAGDATAAADVVRELRALLEPHLALEEAEVIPLLRELRAFPPPASDADATMYAEGFAWAMHGVAEDVVAQVYAILPPAMIDKLPAARAAFVARFARTWGDVAVGATRTSLPA